MALIRKHLEKYEHSRRNIADRRKKVAWAVFSYVEIDTGYEYRKSFTAPANTPEMKFWDIAPQTITL
jgi:hypothetical protein